MSKICAVFQGMNNKVCCIKMINIKSFQIECFEVQKYYICQKKCLFNANSDEIKANSHLTMIFKTFTKT